MGNSKEVVRLSIDTIPISIARDLSLTYLRYSLASKYTTLASSASSIDVRILDTYLSIR